MKYSALFGLAVMALGFSACDDIEDSNSLPQTNPQLPVVSVDNVSVTPGPDASTVLDLSALNAAGKTIDIATLIEATDWPEGFTPSVPFVMLSGTPDFAKADTIRGAVFENNHVYVTADAWETAYVNSIGKSPKQSTTYVGFPVMAVNGDQSVRMGGQDYLYGKFAVEVIPFDLFGGQIIEDDYYLICADDNWNVASARKFSHAAVSPYDDPNFSLVVNVPSAGYRWSIIPASTYEAGTLSTTAGSAFGPEDNDSEATSGWLIANEEGAAPNAGLINVSAPYMFKINMLDMTYSVSMAIDQFYTPGESNGWNAAASQVIPNSGDYTVYAGFANLSGSFKFASAADWSGMNLGNGGPGKLTDDGGAGNLSVSDPGLYWCWFSLGTMEYKTMLISTLGVIGDATPGGWDAATNLTPSADNLTWTGIIEFNGSGEFKFRGNDNWDINLGGEVSNLVYNAANIPTPGAGKYMLTLDLSSIPYSCTFTAQ